MSLPPSNRQCGVCMMDQPIDQFAERYSEQCQHLERIVCNTCVYQNTTATLEHMQNIEVRCPEPNCPAIFAYEQVYQILFDGNNPGLSESYDRQYTYRVLEQMAEFIWCPYPDCDSGQLNENNSSSNQVMCIKCQRGICVYHRIPWHTDMTCDAYDRSKVRLDNRTKQWMKKYAKTCPQCQSPIEKAGGCDHMTCRKCLHQFCWECLADYRRIIRQGLRQHKLTCSYYWRPSRTPYINRRQTRGCSIL